MTKSRPQAITADEPWWCRFASHRSCRQVSAGVITWVRARCFPSKPNRHIIALERLKTGGAVVNGAYGIFTMDGKLTTASRTDRRGQLIADLAPGTYELSRVHSGISTLRDVEIMKLIDDPPARASLRAAAVCPDLPPGVREGARRYLEESSTLLGTDTPTEAMHGSPPQTRPLQNDIGQVTLRCSVDSLHLELKTRARFATDKILTVAITDSEHRPIATTIVGMVGNHDWLRGGIRLDSPALLGRAQSLPARIRVSVTPSRLSVEDHDILVSGLHAASDDASRQVIADLYRRLTREMAEQLTGDRACERTRRQCAMWLQRSRTVEAIDALAGALRDDHVDYRVRSQCARSLAVIGNNRAFDHLVAALNGADQVIGSAVVTALGRFRRADAMAAIAQVDRPGNPAALRQKCRTVLRRVDREAVTSDEKMPATGMSLLLPLRSMNISAYRVACLRYFGGLTISETARALQMSSSTVRASWLAARRWLADQSRQPDDHDREALVAKPHHVSTRDTIDDHGITIRVGATDLVRKPIASIGTIGHVDHGKTTLRAAVSIRQAHKGLAGMSCPGDIDEQKGCVEYESKDIHYTHMDGRSSLRYLQDGRRLDTAILVIDANEGPTSQVHEHVDLARGATTGSIVVFLNKTDAVDDGRLVSVESDVRKLIGRDVRIVKGSALSALKSMGGHDELCKPIDDLVSALDDTIATAQRTPPAAEYGTAYVKARRVRRRTTRTKATAGRVIVQPASRHQWVAYVDDWPTPVRLGTGVIVRTLLVALCRGRPDRPDSKLVQFKTFKQLAHAMAPRLASPLSYSALRTHISRLRRYLEEAGLSGRLIETRPGSGYRVRLYAGGHVVVKASGQKDPRPHDVRKPCVGSKSAATRRPRTARG